MTASIGRAETERLRIEPLDLVHAPGLFAALDDERVGTFIGGPDVTTLERLRERIVALRQGPSADSGQEWLNWAVALAPDGPIVGRLEATRHAPGGHSVGEIAYVFGPAWWGRGFATEATRWLVDHLHRDRGITELWATVAPGNTSSSGLLERLGFTRAEPIDGLLSYDDGDLVFVHR